MEKMTINEATHKWVNEFNSYPRSMIETLMDADPNSWEEVTPPDRNDRVYCHIHGRRTKGSFILKTLLSDSLEIVPTKIRLLSTQRGFIVERRTA